MLLSDSGARRGSRGARHATLQRAGVAAPSATRAVVQFAVAGLVAVALVGASGVFAMRGLAADIGRGNASDVTEVIGRGIVQPNLEPGLLTGDPGALARLDGIVRERILADPIVRVKIWTPYGRVLYADEPRLIGATFTPSEGGAEALRTGSVVAELSDLGEPEHQYEAGNQLLEVYMRLTGPDGQPLVFETYQRDASVVAMGRTAVRSYAPSLGLALLALWLVQVPLAYALARRVRDGQREREALLRRALDASDQERRRIARYLHDGVVQDLAGVSYTLAAASAHVSPGQAKGVRTPLQQAAAGTRRSIRELRSLLVEIYPPSVHRSGLAAAVSDLAAPLASRGVEVSCDIDGGLALAPSLEALLFRVAQEALRNTSEHAGATHAEVALRARDGCIALTISDDGTGFDVDEITSRPPHGHFGLRLLADLAAEAGGTLQVESTPGSGTSIRLEVPLP